MGPSQLPEPAVAATHLVFDINETLLDLSALDSVFDELFPRAGVRAQWFGRLLHWSMVTTLSGRFIDFSELASHSLDQMAAEHRIALDADQRERVFSAIANLAPHDDVVPGLTALRDAGFSLTALTNSAQAMVDRQFDNAGLRPLFEHVLSVEAAQCYKPHPNAYAVAVNALGVPAGQLRLIAAHDWDVTGALRAGLKAAFVARGGAVYHGAGDAPDIAGETFDEVVQAIIATDR